MSKINKIERISYSGGLYGLLLGSAKGELQSKVDEMNQRGWNLHFIHKDEFNLIHILLRVLLLCLTLGIWTLGSSELLIFEKDKE